MSWKPLIDKIHKFLLLNWVVRRFAVMNKQKLFVLSHMHETGKHKKLLIFSLFTEEGSTRKNHSKKKCPYYFSTYVPHMFLSGGVIIGCQVSTDRCRREDITLCEPSQCRHNYFTQAVCTMFQVWSLSSCCWGINLIS